VESKRPQTAEIPVTTALREVTEELGVGPLSVSVVGRLPDVRQELNRFVIAPVVGVLAGETRIAMDLEEIVAVFSVPLATIVSPGAVVLDGEFTKVRGKPMYVLQHGERRIWGLTARIIKSFVEEWNAPAPSLRDVLLRHLTVQERYA